MLNKIEVAGKFENNLMGKYRIKGDPLDSLESLMETYHASGLSIAVIKDNELAWSKCYGVKDLESEEKVDNGTLFQAASLSKPVTALAVMKLVEDGLLDLDKNVNEYLKSWQVPDNGFTKDQPVTLRNLLSHTAGVTVSGFPGYSTDREIPSLLHILKGQGHSNTEAIQVDTVPNTLFRYSGGGTTIVQQVLIDLLDKPFEKIMADIVLQPLQMNNSFFKGQPINSMESAKIASGYDWDGNMVSGKYKVYPEMAAAGLWTTAEDLGKFIIEIQKSLKGEANKVISKKKTLEMIEPVLSGDYSLGLEIEEINGEKLLGHTGGNAGYGCSMIFHEDKGYGLVMMTNSDGGYQLRLPLLRSMAKVYDYSELLYPEMIIQAVSADISSKVSGRYQVDYDESLTIVEVENQLLLRRPTQKDKCLFYVGNNTFIDEARKDLFCYDQASDTMTMNGKGLDKIGEGEDLAMDYMVNGTLDDAVKSYENVLDKSLVSRADLEIKLINTAYDISEIDNNKLAIIMLQVATTLYPESANSWDSLGEIYFEDCQYEKCLRAMKKSLDIDPTNDNAEDYINQAKNKLNL